MSGMFNVPGGSSSPPATPDKSQKGFNFAFGASHPSTTPAGPPPPSSAGSFTPAGAPSESFLGSSIMRGMTGQSAKTQAGASSFGFSGTGTNTGGIGVGSNTSSSGGNKNLFGGSASSQKRSKPTPLGRSIRGKPTTSTHQPSRLSHLVVPDDEEDGEGEEEEEEQTSYRPPAGKTTTTKSGTGTGTFSMPYDDSYTEGDDDGHEEEEDEEDYEEENRPISTRGGYRPQQHEGTDEEDEDDLWLGMQGGGTPRRAGGFNGDMGDVSDLMMMNTPAAERVRKEAEDIFRASTMQGPRRGQHKFAALAKDLCGQMGTALIQEPTELILATEALVNKLYDDGVGEADDEEKLDDTLARAASDAVSLWEAYADKIPQSGEEHAAEIGPGPNSAPFQKASYLANLALRVHHTRCDRDGIPAPEPLPLTLFNWQHDFHNLYHDQLEDILKFKPSPACHSLFWETIFIALIRGNLPDVIQLLTSAGWAHVRRGQRGEYAYRDQALVNLQRVVDETIAMLETCPGFDDDWEIWSSSWTLFRVRAQGTLDNLRKFAEGKDEDLGDSTFSASAQSVRDRETMTGLARRAESNVPWDVYENLTVIFNIVLGDKMAILGAAQDWCEATIGLFGWLDEKKGSKPIPGIGLSQSQALIPVGLGADTDSYFERLARAFHMATSSDFQVNVLNPVEIGMACVFEDNSKGLIGILRGWSLPIAAAVAEIASLGKWLPPHQPYAAFAMEDLDMDDLEVLGMDRGSPDEVDGIKDSTLVQYAQALADVEEDFNASVSSSARGRNADGPQYGWELAIQVLGRLDSSERSEEMVGILVKNLIESLDVDSEATVEKIWGILNELGMIPFAEETAETYGEILARSSHRYGSAMWYFALAHRPAKVREVMNLLISYSLIQSTSYPPNNDLDDHLHRLLTDRNKTLEACAKQDLEAAELLGKMLSGYASLRQFYEIRDHGDENPLLSSSSPVNRRRQAAAALVSVIASSDDNIRGGLFDASRDGIVSEDFLLALLGEATVFVTDPENTNVHHGRTASPVITLEQIDIILKAIEDLQAVGERVYTAADEFLQLVLSSAPGGTLRGSTPADLLRSVSATGSFEIKGSSLVASQLQKSLSGKGAGNALGKINVARGWDWRAGLEARTKGADIMQRLRLGLAKDLASLWLKEADGEFW